MTYTADYSLKAQDSAGRTVELFITGACIDEAIAKNGTPEWEARENVESNAFWAAVERGEIGEDAWLV
jgi:hypothetical protein